MEHLQNTFIKISMTNKTKLLRISASEVLSSGERPCDSFIGIYL